MRLENTSPFPIDQLYWGCLYDKDEHAVLLYATYSERLTLDQRAELLGEDIQYAFPSFIPLLNQKFSEPTIIFLSATGSFSALTFDAETTLPTHIETIPILTSEEETRQELLASLETDSYTPQPAYWELEKIQLLPNKSVQFESKYCLEEEYSTPYTLTLPEKDKTTWNADIRPRLLINEKYKQNKTVRFLWNASIAALTLCGIFILLEILGLLGQVYLTSQKSLFKSQEPKVKIIEDQESLVQKIEDLSHHNYPPLKTLELLNNYRPKKIYFTLAQLGNKNNAKIEGIAESVDDLNKYTDTLNTSGLIQKLEVSEILSRQGKVSFKMDVTFNSQTTPSP